MLVHRNEDFYVRCCTAWALGRIGSSAKPAIRVLITVIGQEYGYLRESDFFSELDFDVEEVEEMIFNEVCHPLEMKFHQARNELLEAAEFALDKILVQEKQ